MRNYSFKPARYFSLLFLALAFSICCFSQPAGLGPYDKRIDMLFGRSAKSANPLLIEYYIQSLKHEITKVLNISPDSVARYISHRVSHQYNPEINKQKEIIAKLVKNEQLKIDQYKVRYGDYSKALFVQNDFIQVDPSIFSKLYNYTNSWLMDSLASRIEQHSDTYIISEYKKLNNNLARRIRQGNKAAIDEFFKNMSESLDKSISRQADAQITKFSAKLLQLKDSLVDKTTIEILVSKTMEFAGADLYSLKVLKNKIENNIDKVDLNYLAIKLAEHSKVDNTIIEKIKGIDVGSIGSFITNVQNETVQKFKNTIKQQTDNLIQIQEGYRNKLKENSHTLTEFVEKANRGIVENIENIEGEYRKIANTLPHISENMVLLSGLIQEGQNKLNGEVNRFYNKFINEPSKKAEAALFLASFFIDTKDYATSLRDIRNSLPFNAGSMDKEFTSAKESLLKTKEGFVSNVNSYLNTANLVIGSFQALGIGNQATLNKISKGIQLGTSVFNAVTAFASGNYLGAVQGLGGMMGSRDAGADRHAEIMAALKQINAKLDVVIQKLDVVLENQARMYELQKETYKQLLMLRDTVLKEFDQLNEKVDVMSSRLNFLIARKFLDQLGACRDICDRLNLSVDANRLNVQTLNDVWASISSSKFKKVEELFNDHTFLLPDKKIRPLYLNSVFEDVTDISESEKIELRSLSKFYQDLLKKANLSANSFFNKNDRENLSLSLLTPSFNYQELNYKLNQPKISRSDNQKELTINHIAEYISPEICKAVAEMILRSHLIVAVTDRNSDLIKIDEGFIDHSLLRSRTAAEYLSNALMIVNAAIAEQNLLGGDLLLETMRQEYKSFMKATKDSQQLKLYKFNNSLVNHPAAGLFYSNFIRYYITKEIEESKSPTSVKPFSFASYKFAYDSMDSTLMNKGTVAFPFHIVYVDNEKQVALRQKNIVLEQGWFANVEGKYHPMPAPIEFEASEGFKLNQSRYLNSLLFFRDKLINKIESYEFINRMTQQEEKEAVNYALIMQE